MWFQISDDRISDSRFGQVLVLKTQWSGIFAFQAVYNFSN